MQAAAQDPYGHRPERNQSRLPATDRIGENCWLPFLNH